MTKLFILLLAAVTLAVFSIPPLAAQERSAPLLRMLQALPMSMADTVDVRPDEIYFGDPEVARTVIAQALGGRVIAAATAQEPAPFQMDFDGAIGSMLRVADPDMGRAAYRAEPEGWVPLLGFAAGDMRQRLITRKISSAGIFIRFDPALLSGIGTALLANGYDPLALGKYPAFARGEDDYSMDREGSNDHDPFGGRFGSSSRVALMPEGLLLQSPGVPGLWVMTQGDSARLGDAPKMRDLLVALDDPAAGSGAILRAMVFPSPLVLTATDPAPSGLRMGILADTSDGIQVHAALALAYDSRDAAEAAALPQRWAERCPRGPTGPAMPK